MLTVITTAKTFRRQKHYDQHEGKTVDVYIFGKCMIMLLLATARARALNFSLEFFRGMTENGAVISSFIENLHSTMPVILSDVYL